MVEGPTITDTSSRLTEGATSELALPTITRTALALFAGASGDHNSIHIDIDAAHRAGLNDVFAHGMLSMAYLGRLLTGWFPPEAIRSFSVRFSAITPVLAEIIAIGRITAVERKADERLATVELEARTTDGTLTIKGSARVVLPHET